MSLLKRIFNRLDSKIAEQEETQTPNICDYDSYCPNCDLEICNNVDSMTKFCPECGQEIINPFHCLICNTPLNATAKYCCNCGMLAIR